MLSANGAQVTGGAPCQDNTICIVSDDDLIDLQNLIEKSVAWNPEIKAANLAPGDRFIMSSPSITSVPVLGEEDTIPASDGHMHTHNTLTVDGWPCKLLPSSYASQFKKDKTNELQHHF